MEYVRLAEMSETRFELRDALPTGAVVGGYLVDAVLGYGGYSVVYRARHAELGHIVALKEYLPADLSVRQEGTVHPRSSESLPHYEDGKRRFLEEARQIVQFKDDPGVVACLDFFRANGTAYLAMEHVEGMSLAELLRQREGRGNPLDEHELRFLVVPLLETLSRLHKADVLHRDIKPSNILVRQRDGMPVLIDFGAAKQHATVHSKSAAPFTEGYAALEQVGEGELGPWTDVYAIGAVMWRVVAGGRPPWDPPNPKKVEFRASAALSGQPDPLPSAVELGKGRFSLHVLVAIDECLRIRRAERIRNCEEVLQRVIEGTTATAESTTGASVDDPKSASARGQAGNTSAPAYGTGNITNPSALQRVSLFARWVTGLVVLVTGLISSLLISDFLYPIRYRIDADGLTRIGESNRLVIIAPIIVGIFTLIYVVSCRESLFLVRLISGVSYLTRLLGLLVFSLGVWWIFLPIENPSLYIVAITIGVVIFGTGRGIYRQVK